MAAKPASEEQALGRFANVKAPETPMTVEVGDATPFEEAFAARPVKAQREIFAPTPAVGLRSEEEVKVRIADDSTSKALQDFAELGGQGPDEAGRLGQHGVRRGGGRLAEDA